MNCKTDNGKKKIAVLASGNGSNFEALAQACKDEIIPAEVVLLVCDKPAAYVCERAAKLGIETFAFRPKEYASKEEYEMRIIELLKARGVDLICLAGYMRLLSPVLLEAYNDRILNIHPSLLPSFKGAHGIKDSFEYGVKVFGVTVHLVNNELDGGKIISQRAFEYHGNDMAEVEHKIHAIEHVLYPEAVNELIENGLV